MRSNGNSQTCTQKGACWKVTENVVIPTFHLRKSSRWLSKLHGPSFMTHSSWLSNENLNWRSLSPTFVIFKSFPNFQIDRSRFFAALRLMDFEVKKHPSRLREHYSKVFSWWSEWTMIISPSSTVRRIRCSRFIKSESMMFRPHQE